MERLMQFVWQHRLGLRQDLHTVDGRRVRVLDQGTLNFDSGPDFFNATIEIDDETWVGNVEIHVRASDWYRHHHDVDDSYDSVILHVVQFDDAPVKRRDGSIIPQLVIKCSPDSAKRCNMLLDYALRSLPCKSVLVELPSIYKVDWLTALGMERLYSKSDRILDMVSDSGGYWEGAAYVTFARALGFGLNSEPFEMLARSVPLQFLNKHHDELLSVEAILFGRAGMIPVAFQDEDLYVTRLRQEYDFMTHKFQLTPFNMMWKMSRTRPQNFPYRRIALLAEMIHRGFYLVGDLCDCKTVDDMRNLFNVHLTGFWANHFSFNGKGGCSPKALSGSSINTLVINVAIPLLHARYMSRGDFEGMERCVDLLQSMESENNTITRLFVDAGIECDNAFISQALIELRREYCEKKKCIYCRWGHRMLSAEIQR